MATRKRTVLEIYELYVELEDIEPLIWRRLLVPATITLPKLHHLLQLAMGWTNSHLHSFTIGNQTFGMAGADLEELGMLDERRQTLGAALGNSVREFLYEYDFGDDWRCRITVRPVAQPNTDWHYRVLSDTSTSQQPRRTSGRFRQRGYQQ